MSVPAELLRLAHAVADPALDTAILAEGNVSTVGGGDSLWIKGSGRQMACAVPDDFVEVLAEPVLRLLHEPVIDETAVRHHLNSARLNPNGTCLPSTETFMHAYLLSLPEIQYVAHGHPASLIGILSLARAPEYARIRLFPDEVVLCGAATCFVPYVAPGLPLAIAIRSAVEHFVSEYGVHPKTIWLQNHGLIAVGKTDREAESALRMAVKASRVLLGALQTAQELRPMTADEIQQIAHWPDEHYRQRQLWGEEA